MNDLLEPTDAPTEGTADSRQEAAKYLESDWAGIRIRFSRFGTRRSFSKGEKQETANVFDANADYLSAASKIIDTKHPAYKQVTGAITRIRETWTDATLPYPEDGTRLIRQDRIDELVSKLEDGRANLMAAVENLNLAYDDLREKARRERGRLFNPGDYPSTLVGQFSVSWDFPELNPPPYLQSINPKLYAEQSARVAARFDEAVQLAEEAFIAELDDCIGTLQKKLSGLDDGTERRLMQSTLDNLDEFFRKFQKLNLHSSAELDRVVAQAKDALSAKGLFGGGSISRDELRNSANLRRDVATRLSAVAAQLEGLSVAAPRRAINRRKPAETAAAQTDNWEASRKNWEEGTPQIPDSTEYTEGQK